MMISAHVSTRRLRYKDYWFLNSFILRWRLNAVELDKDQAQMGHVKVEEGRHPKNSSDSKNAGSWLLYLIQPFAIRVNVGAEYIR